MSSAPLMPRTGFKFVLLVKDGPDKGASYQLLPPKVTLGRGPENNVVLTDPRVSRHSAVIEISMEKIVIMDLSSRKSMLINGKSVSEATIKDGDTIQLGDTVILFRVEALALTPPIPQPSFPAEHRVPNEFPSAYGSPSSAGHHAGRQARPRPASPPAGGVDAGKIKFYVVVGAVLLLFVWLLNEEPQAKRKDRGLKTVEEIETELKESQKRQATLSKKRDFASNEERTRYEEAQRHFLSGFRDYQKGQWGRAMRSFETARAIDPQHELAGRYYRLAEKQRDELVATYVLEGKRYKEKNMYTRCSAAFEKVLDVIPNKQDLKYRSAEALKKECDLLIQDRFD